MKILRIITRLNIGGPSWHVIWLTHYLKEKGHKTFLIAGKIGKNEKSISEEILKKYNVFPMYIPTLQREISPLKDIIAFCNLVYLIFKIRPDIIHTHTSKAGFLGRIAGFIYKKIFFFKKIKIYHTFHGHIFRGYFSKRLTKLFIFLEYLTAKISNNIICLGETLANELVEYQICSKKQIKIIPLGIDPQIEPKSSSKKSSEKILLSVGRLVPIKNHYFLIEVVKLLVEKYNQHLKLLIVGDGPLRGSLEELIKKYKLSKHIKITGFVENPFYLYSRAYLHIICSLNEGTPLSIIEAGIHGVPTIAVDVGGIKDIIIHNHTGIIIPDHNKEIFAQNIIRILSDEKFHSFLSKNVKEYMIKHHHIKRLVEDLLVLYRE